MGAYLSRTEVYPEKTFDSDYNIYDSSLPTIFEGINLENDNAPETYKTNCSGCQKKYNNHRSEPRKTEREILRELKYIKISLKRLHEKLGD